jgi:hypothetical protein
MLLAKSPFTRAAQSSTHALVARTSSICTIRRPLAVIASADKAVGTNAMAEVKDVAPKVLNTIQMTIKYGGSAFTDGQHLGKAQVR